MASQSTANIKKMSELSMLTILIQAATAIKNDDGDPSMHGYAETQLRKKIDNEEVEVNFTVLDSIGDILLQKHQILAISPNKPDSNNSATVTVLLSADSDIEHPAEDPIERVSKVSSISATVVPNPNDRRQAKAGLKNSKNGPLGNLEQVMNGKSMWEEVKNDSLCGAVE
jgi:hypothetical protein